MSSWPLSLRLTSLPGLQDFHEVKIFNVRWNFAPVYVDVFSNTSTYNLTFQEPFKARLAQSAERKALNLVVVGSSPTVGDTKREASAKYLYCLEYVYILYTYMMSIDNLHATNPCVDEFQQLWDGISRFWYVWFPILLSHHIYYDDEAETLLSHHIYYHDESENLLSHHIYYDDESETLLSHHICYVNESETF